MAHLRSSATLFVLFLALHSAFSSDLENSSPSPSPEVGADTKSPISLPPASSPEISSPPKPHSPSSPAPEVSNSPSPSPSPSDSLSPPADEDSPSPSPEAHFRGADSIAANTAEEKSSHGMSGGKKFGIAMVVLVGAGVVVFAGIVYKKRQDNIRRSQYGSATRRGLI